MTMLADHIRKEHKGIHPHLEALLAAAHAVGEVPAEVLRDLTGGSLGFLQGELLPHAAKEDGVLYSAVERSYGADGTTDAMKREHREIERFVGELSELHGAIVTGGDPGPETVRALRQVLYGLHAVISLHLKIEEEVYLPVLGDRLDPHAEHQMMVSQEHG